MILLLLLSLFFNPSVLRTPPLYFAVQNTGEEGEMYFSFAFAPILYATPHKVTGHGRGRRLNADDFLSQPKKVLVTLIRFLGSFFSTARRTNQEAPPLLSGFWVRRRSRRRGLRNSLRSDSPRPFSSVFLATSPPDKGGIGVCAFACILIPSPFSPYCYCNFPQCYETRQGRD